MNETRVFTCCANVIVANVPLVYTNEEIRSFLRRPCSTCGAKMKHKRLIARQSAKRCGAACYGSKAAACACSCAGANHGGAFRETKENANA